MEQRTRPALVPVATRHLLIDARSARPSAADTRIQSPLHTRLGPNVACNPSTTSTTRHTRFRPLVALRTIPRTWSPPPPSSYSLPAHPAPLSCPPGALALPQTRPSTRGTPHIPSSESESGAYDVRMQACVIKWLLGVCRVCSYSLSCLADASLVLQNITVCYGPSGPIIPPRLCPRSPLSYPRALSCQVPCPPQVTLHTLYPLWMLSPGSHANVAEPNRLPHLVDVPSHFHLAPSLHAGACAGPTGANLARGEFDQAGLPPVTPSIPTLLSSSDLS